MGVIFFVYNAVFALVLLIMVLASSYFALSSKNPDTRYQPMRDDRGSFIKSNPQLTTELDALGATARGDGKPALYCAVIVKTVDAQTRSKTGINELLRD